MAQPFKMTNLEQLIALLNDGQWHSEHELAGKVAWRFGSIIYEARHKGHSIETREVANNQFEYRLVGKTLWLEELKTLAQQLPEKIPYLKMLVLFGSRATGKTHANSDWDFAALYDENLRKAYIKNPFAWFEAPTIIGQFFKIPDDEVDVVELNNSPALIAHFVARDGKLLYEKEPGEFEAFRKRALKSNTEMEQIRTGLQEKVEASLKRWGV